MSGNPKDQKETPAASVAGADGDVPPPLQEGKLAHVPNVARKMDPKEQARLQAQIGHLKSQNADFIMGESKQSRVLESKEKVLLKDTPTVYFKNCSDSEYTVSKRTSKILIESCNNCTITLNEQILTAIVEIWKCDNITLKVNTPVRTLQLDLLKGLQVDFSSKAKMECVVWNHVEGLSLNFADAAEFDTKTGFAEMKAVYPDSSLIVDQFIIRFVEGKLLSERCIRLKNGFLSTEREADAWDKRNDLAKERYVQNFLKEAGINLNKAKNSKKVPVNDPCPCGSNKKYKKCCMNKKELTGVDQSSVLPKKK